MEDLTTIQISKETRQKLEQLKEYPNQINEELLDHILNIMLDIVNKHGKSFIADNQPETIKEESKGKE